MPTYLVTGCQGKVGRYVVERCRSAGIDVVGIDLVRGIYDAPAGGDAFPATYIQADLQDAGAVFSTVSRFKPDAVIHIAAIPDPTHNPPHIVFQTNMMATFNVVEACVRLGVPRLVNISSEQVPGFFASDRVVPGSGLPSYCPVDEAHPIAPQNPYALSKHFGEQLCDAAVRRTAGLSVVSIRPSWCQDEGNVERNLGPLVRDPSLPNEGMWSYIMIPDLADAVVRAADAAAVVVSGHEVVYIAAADNAGGRDLAAAVLRHYGAAVPVRPLPRPDASGIDCSKARRLLGWEPKLTWRDYLSAEGRLLPGAGGKRAA